VPDSLQSQLDAITAQTRSLVQPERLAITDQAIHDLLDSGIESRVLAAGSSAPTFALPDALTGKLVRSSDLLALGPVIVRGRVTGGEFGVTCASNSPLVRRASGNAPLSPAEQPPAEADADQ